MLNPLKYLRKLIAILRGGSTSVEISLAITLGVVLGMLPGFSLLTIALFLLALLLNIPFRLFILTFILGSLISMPLTYVTFATGAFLLTIGPIESAARALVNAPVTAWMDFDRYCTLGGILVGVVIGLLLSAFAVIFVRSFRRKIASLEAHSEKFVRFERNIVVRILVWLLLGRGRKKGMTYSDVLTQRTRPLRKSALAVGMVFLVLALIGNYLFAGHLAKSGLVWGMESVNGATVDVEAVDIDFFEGHCDINEMQVCDPDHLDRNLVSVGKVTFDFNIADLLSKRLVIDEIAVIDAETDTPREEKGRRIFDEEPIPEEKPPGSIWDYLEEARKWKERIERVYRLYERIRPKDKTEPDEDELKRIGYKNMRASYLVEEKPSLQIKKITVGGIGIEIGGTKSKCDIEVTDLSTNPKLALINPNFTFSSQDKKFGASITFSLIDTASPHILSLTAKDLNLEDIQRVLSKDNNVRFASGRADLSVTDGKLSLDALDIPLSVKLRDVNATGGDEKLLGLNPEVASALIKFLKEIDTTLLIKGKPYAPYVDFDTKGLLDSIIKAGKAELGAGLKEGLKEGLERALEK
ncbi:MAG: DUF2062 domain-containing protein, partial [Planctomycetota bacterium]